MLTADMIATVEKQRLGFTATVSPDGTPNVSPKGTFIVIDENTLAFAEIRSPNTLRNLRANPAIEVNFVNPLSRKGFRAKGTGLVLAPDEAGFREAIKHFERWGVLAERIRHIVTIAVETAMPLTSPAYDDGATTEADLRARWAEILLSD